MSTPALRLLDQKKKDYRLHSYATEDGLLDGKSVVKKLGISEDDLYKTLVVHTPQENILVFLIPVSQELDMKKAASLLGVKKLSLLPLKDLKRLTGYAKGGCSPLAMKKSFPTYLPEEAKKRTSLLVNGGALGSSIELAPSVLEELVDLHYLPL